VEMLQKIADAFDVELAVAFVPNADELPAHTRVGQTQVAAAS